MVAASCHADPPQPRIISIEELSTKPPFEKISGPLVVEGTVAVATANAVDDVMLQFYLPNPEIYGFATHVKGAVAVKGGDRVALRCGSAVVIQGSPYLWDCIRAAR